MNGFSVLAQFLLKKIDAYIRHELIAQLIPTGISYDLLTVSHFWPSKN